MGNLQCWPQFYSQFYSQNDSGLLSLCGQNVRHINLSSTAQSFTDLWELSAAVHAGKQMMANFCSVHEVDDDV